DCPTCHLIVPVLTELAAAGLPLTIYSQDDPAFPPGLPVVDDAGLEVSLRLDIETVPTLIRVTGGEVVERTEGWRRNKWEDLTAVAGLGRGLPDYRPGCGSRTLEPGIAETLAPRSGVTRPRSRPPAPTSSTSTGSWPPPTSSARS